MDNRIFNVNGRTKDQLALAIKLLLLDEYDRQQTVDGWYFSQKKGLVLTWYVGGTYKATPFTDRMGNKAPVTETELVDILWDWLLSPEAKTVACEGTDADADHDGHNNLGWRLYTESWGHIQEGEYGTDHYSIAAFKPAFLWYGK